MLSSPHVVVCVHRLVQHKFAEPLPPPSHKSPGGHYLHGPDIGAVIRWRRLMMCRRRSSRRGIRFEVDTAATIHYEQDRRNYSAEERGGKRNCHEVGKIGRQLF